MGEKECIPRCAPACLYACVLVWRRFQLSKIQGLESTRTYQSTYYSQNHSPQPLFYYSRRSTPQVTKVTDITDRPYREVKVYTYR